MRTIRFILQKEFIQIFRDKSMIPIIFVIPVVQLLILSFTATFEIKNTRLIIWDQSRTIDSRSLISKFDRSPFFSLEAYVETYEQGIEWLKKGKADQLLILDPSFATDLQMGEKGKVMLVTDAINGSAASLMNAYAMSILTDYNKQLLVAKYPLAKTAEPVELRSSHWYNPELDYKTYMVPGILVLLVTIIGMFLSGMNIVKEKELGTIEQINVTPIKKYQFMIGKLLPFWIIALFELAIGLVVARLVFGIPILGSVPLLFGVASVYLLVILGFGLLISTLTDTMQQAMFISWFFMVIFILLSGLFTPVESMPQWAQQLNLINPIAYFIRINRMIMLKGSAFGDFANTFYALVLYATSILTLAVWRYRKVS
ncbi:MAG: ABC transporter permease [Bacteroidetes bacterium]|nr:ABC transporter permease [Bacteroidales bacterium]MBU1008696.1 ABC transporter permease [Bacteroidota bacterium]